MMREQHSLSQYHSSTAAASPKGYAAIASPHNEKRLQAEEIVKHLYQGILDPRHWRTFLQCLRKYMDCDIAAMLLSGTDKSVAYAIWDRRVPLGEPERVMASEYRNFIHLDPLLNTLRSTNKICTLDEVISFSELNKSEYYRCVIKRFDFIYQLATHIAEPNGLECYIGVVNGSAGPNFGAAEKQLLSALRADIECALTIFS